MMFWVGLVFLLMFVTGAAWVVVSVLRDYKEMRKGKRRRERIVKECARAAFRAIYENLQIKITKREKG